MSEDDVVMGQRAFVLECRWTDSAVVRGRDGRAVAHRPLWKVIVNRVLRIAGWQVATLWKDDPEEIVGYHLCRCDR